MGLGALKLKVKRRFVGSMIAKMLKGSGWIWRALDGWKTWIVAVLALAKLVCTDCGPTLGYLDAVIRALGWDTVAGAFDPEQVLTAALVLIALGHKLAKAVAQFRAGAKVVDIGTPKGAATLLEADSAWRTSSVAAISVPKIPEWAKIVLGVLRRLLNAGADKGLWYSKKGDPTALGIVSLPEGWWAKLRAKLFAALERAIGAWLEGTGQTPPEPEPPVVEEPEEPTGPVVPIPDPVEPETPQPPVVIPPPAKPRIVRVGLEPTYRTVKQGKQCQIRVLVEREQTLSDGTVLKTVERGGMGLDPKSITWTDNDKPSWSASVSAGTPAAAYATIGVGGPKPRENATPEPALAFGGIIYSADRGAAANIKVAKHCPLGPLSVRCEIEIDGVLYTPSLSGDKAPQVVAG